MTNAILRRVKPLISELNLLSECRLLSRENLLNFETFIARAAKIRKIQRPWIKINNASSLSSREGILDANRNLIILGGYSWPALLHEWHHWIVGQRYGWNHVESKDSDVYAEAFSRSYMCFLNPTGQEAIDTFDIAKRVYCRKSSLPCGRTANLAGLTVHNVVHILNKINREKDARWMVC